MMDKALLAVVLSMGPVLPACHCVRLVMQSVPKTSFGVPSLEATRGSPTTVVGPAGQEMLQPPAISDYCNLPVRGLTNADGSSCFINSALQFIMAVPGLCEVVFNEMSLPPAETDSQEGEATLAQLLDLFRQVYSTTSTGDSVPGETTKVVRWGLHHFELVHELRGQEDSQEFLVTLLNRFNDSAKENASVLSHVSKFQEFKWEDPLSTKKASVNKEGASSECNTDSPAVCKTTGMHEKPVMMLLPMQLPFSTSGGGTTLQDKFNLEFRTDHTDDPENALKVYKDGMTYEFSKWSMTTELVMPPPKYLLLGYKRFDLNYVTYDPIKLDDAVTTPLHMLHPACHQRSLHSSQACNWHYRLEAVVQHVGTLASAGHYVSAVRGRGSAEERQKWYYLSDSTVREITLLEVKQIADKCFYAGYVLANEDEISSDVFETGDMGRALVRTNDDDISIDGFEAGDMVRVRGLTGKYLNFRYGSLIFFNQTTGAWQVELEDGLVVSIKGKNLEAAIVAMEQPETKKPRGLNEE